eukprot:gene195-350_t
MIKLSLLQKHVLIKFVKSKKSVFISCLSKQIHTIRNVGIVAHIDAGKTTTTEQMLYLTGQIKNVGRVDSGDTVMDFLPQERERGITIASAAISFKWKDYHINLIDTPGHVDFTVEVERCVRVLDGAILIVDAVAGVQAQTRTVWKQACKQNIPSIAFINKMDRDGAEFKRTVESIRNKLGINPIAVQFPIGSEDNFRGVIDLISFKKIEWAPSSSRAPSSPILSAVDISDPLYDEASLARTGMIENLAELDEVFMEKYLDVTAALLSKEQSSKGDDHSEHLGLDIFPQSELLDVLRRVCIQNNAVPVLCGASLRGKGVEPLLDAACVFLPSPLDRPPATAVDKRHLSSSPSTTTTSTPTTGAKKEILPQSNDLCALAFKVECNPTRGLMVYIRTYAGTLLSKQSLFNSSKQIRERPTHIFRVNANDLIPVDTIGPGDVACLLGLKHTVTGDTLVVEKGPLQCYELDRLTVPEAVFSLAVEPEKSSQQEELEEALRILCLEDPSLRVDLDVESGQTLLRGIGELHLDIVCDKLKRRFKIEVQTGKAYVAYRESLVDGFSGIDLVHVYDRNLGTKRMFASIRATVKSTGSCKECVVTADKYVKDMISNDEYIALIEGMNGALQRGPQGFPVVGLHVSIHEVIKDQDTTPGSVRACCSTFIDSILRGEEHVLLEPIMSLEIDSPAVSVGDVLSDLTVTRRGIVREVISSNMRNIILGEVPLATMLGYATTIRSITKGEGSFSMEYCNHVVV